MKYTDILNYIPAGYTVFDQNKEATRARNGLMHYRCFLADGYVNIEIEEYKPEDVVASAEASSTFFLIKDGAEVNLDGLAQMIADLEEMCHKIIGKHNGVINETDMC